MSNLILYFNQDRHTKEAVHKYLIQVLMDRVIEKAFKGEPTDYIKHAKEDLDFAFDKMDLDFPTQVKKIDNSPE